MGIMNTLKRIIAGPDEQALPDLGRNEHCWCGSGRKYKACHLAKDARRRSAMRTANAASASSVAQRGF